MVEVSAKPIQVLHVLGSLNRAGGLARRAYLALMSRWLDRHATSKVAVSGRSASALFGESWRDDPRVRIQHLAIDLSSFEPPCDRAAVRRELGLPEDAFIVGHVGRFDRQKNHAFLIEVAAEVLGRDPRARFLL